jgi:hypothetical protein
MRRQSVAPSPGPTCMSSPAFTALSTFVACSFDGSVRVVEPTRAKA